MSKTLTYIFFFLFCLLFCSAHAKDKRLESILENEISSPTKYIEQAFDVLHYDAILDLTKAPNRDTKGVCRIKLFWKDKSLGEKFFFHLRGLEVDSCFYENTKVEAIPSGIPSSSIYHYEILKPKEIEKDTVVLTIYYSGRMTAEPVTQYNPWGGVHSYTDILFAIGVGIYNNYVSTTEHWLPCYDHPSDKATFNFKFIVKAGKKVASNGNMKIHYLDNGTDIYEYSSDFPCATYLMTFAVGNFIEDFLKYNDIPIQLFYLSKDSINTKHSFSKLGLMIQMLQDKFIPYPFEKVGYVVTPIGSMEHQTMISIDADVLRSYFLSKDTLCVTVLHELSHQWFGNLVTPYDYRDAWLNEAFATFCENLWVEHIQGKKSYLDYLSNQIDTYFKTVINREGVIPLYNYQKVFTAINYPWTIYIKGAAVLALLRFYLGDSLFFNAIRYHLNKFAYSNATSEDLLNSLEEFCNLDLNWFFEQWVYNHMYPKIKVQYNSQDNIGTPFLKITQTGDYIFKNLPVEITFIYKDGKTINKVYNLDSVDNLFYKDIPQSVDSIIVNKGDAIRTLIKVEEVIITNVLENEQFEDKVDFNIYPNPGSDFIIIKFQEAITEFRYSIIDILGINILESKVQLAIPESVFEIKCNSIDSGFYFIILELNGSYYAKPFLINKFN